MTRSISNQNSFLQDRVYAYALITVMTYINRPWGLSRRFRLGLNDAGVLYDVSQVTFCCCCCPGSQVINFILSLNV
jgi:hypothetical protein